MWLVAIPLVVGYIFGAGKPVIAGKLPMSLLTNGSTVLLLIFMGAKLGATPEILEQLTAIGLHALLLAGATVLGSIVSLYLMSFLIPKNTGPEVEGIAPPTRAHGLALSLLFFGAVIAGFSSGYLVGEGMLSLFTSAPTWVLGFLLLVIGIDLGRSDHLFLALRRLGPTVILIPVAIIIGSLIGGVSVSPVGGLSWQEGAAVASGFGWYSLSSLIITDIHSPLLGAMAFLTNVFREMIALIITPLVARKLGGLVAIAPGGATSMDVLLPAIVRGGGSHYASLAFFSGGVLSLAVPFFVRLFLQL